MPNATALSLLLCLPLALQPSGAPPTGGGDVSGRTVPDKRQSPSDRGKPEAAPASPGTSLRPRFTPGRETRYSLKLSSTQDSKFPNTPEIDSKTESEQVFTITLRTTAVSETGADMELVIDALKYTYTMNDATASVSVPAPPNAKPPAKESVDDKELRENLELVTQGVAGSKITFRMDPTGKITSVTGGEALGGSSAAAALAGQLGGGVGGVPPPANPTQWFVSGMTSGGGGGALPESVTTGQTWTNADSLARTPVGDFKMVTRHRVTSANERRADIDFKGEIEPSQPGATPSEGGFKINAASYTGSWSWDAANGELARMATHIKTDIGGVLLAGPVESRSETRMSMERIDRFRDR